jgi:hypothetical protein
MPPCHAHILHAFPSACGVTLFLNTGADNDAWSSQAANIERKEHRTLSSEEMFLSAGQANNPDSASFATVRCLCCSTYLESQKCERYCTFHKVFCEHCWDYDNLECRGLKMIVVNIQQSWRLHRGDGSRISHDFWNQLITQDLMGRVWTLHIEDCASHPILPNLP